MKCKGSITIYLSIIFVSVILLINIVSESARVRAVQAKSEEFTYLAADSVMAGYARQVYKDYGILLVWERQPIEEQIKTNLQANINMADLNFQGTNFMNTHLINVEVLKRGILTDEGGEAFAEQIASYMKYAGVLKAVDELTQKFKMYNESGDTQQRKNEDVTYIIDDAENELEESVKCLKDIIVDLKNTEDFEKRLSEASQKLEDLKENILSGSSNTKEHDKRMNKFLRKYRKLSTLLDKEADKVDDAMILIKQYETKKARVLKETGYTSGEEDYIEEDLKILKNVENTMKEIGELAVSEFSDIDSKNISIVENAIKKAGIIKNELKSLKVNEVTEEDEKKESVYQTAKTFLENGILSLVIDDVSKVSNASISDSNLPTNLPKEKDEKSFWDKTKNKAIFAVYTDMKFGNYRNVRKDAPLKYEMEYIVNGKYNDKENLTSTIEKIVAVRNVVNLAYLVTDSKKMGEISAVAASAAAVTGLPFLEPVFKAVLIEAWALAESISETKDLLKGGKISIVKSRTDWRTELENLGKTNNSASKNETGLTYQNYLQILIMLGTNHDCIYRTMDLIQINIQNKYNCDFLMNQCFQTIDIKADFETEPIFTAIPAVMNLINRNNGTYKYSISCSKKY